MSDKLSREQLKSQVNSLGKVGWTFKKICHHFVKEGLALSADVESVWDEINADIRYENKLAASRIRKALESSPSFRKMAAEVIGAGSVRIAGVTVKV